MTQSQPSVLVHCVRYSDVDGRLVQTSFGYMCSGASIWDHELVAWAERRDAQLREKRS